MTEPNEWPELARSIESTRTARDRSAEAGRKAALLGIPTLADDLDRLAATYDKLLAQLLYLQRTFPAGPPDSRA
jgi:hypothetical protein